MTQGDHVRINDKREVEAKLPFILKRNRVMGFNNPLVVKLDKYESPRSLSQNAIVISGTGRSPQKWQKKGHKIDHAEPDPGVEAVA